MPAKSQAQQRAAGAALAARRGDMPRSKLYGASKQMAQMDTSELKKFAGTKRTGLPDKKEEALQRIGSSIVATLLSEDDERAGTPDEAQDVGLARNILTGLKRLQGSLPDPTPEQLHALTTVRAAAQSLIRMHSA